MSTSATHEFKDVTEEQNRNNSYARLVPGQKIVEIPHFDLECGETLHEFPVAYKTWGRLNRDKDNVLMVFHAFTGSSDVQDWWGPLLGTNKTFDPSRFFIICFNFLGSPYGSCSPLTIDKRTGEPYGPNFPLVTIKDDLGIQKMILDSMGVTGIACVIGGSMGGMLALEYAARYRDSNYVKTVVALATSARASAWCISWNEAQRQCIFSDPNYDDGFYYEDPNGKKPDGGLSAARMSALLTYRSSNSFENRFGRNPGNLVQKNQQPQDIRYPKNEDERNWLLHNEGSRSRRGLASSSSSSSNSTSNSTSTSNPSKAPHTYFTAQSYLRYQGNKFVKRFDANCYISISRKLDTHDITRGVSELDSLEEPLPKMLSWLNQHHLVIGILSDGLFTFTEQQMLEKHLPNSRLETLQSQEGHDAFLLDFEIINNYCLQFMHEKIPEYFDNSGKVEIFDNWQDYVKSVDNGGNSVFGEAEKNITNW